MRRERFYTPHYGPTRLTSAEPNDSNVTPRVGYCSGCLFVFSLRWPHIAFWQYELVGGSAWGEVQLEYTCVQEAYLMISFATVAHAMLCVSHSRSRLVVGEVFCRVKHRRSYAFVTVARDSSPTSSYIPVITFSW